MNKNILFLLLSIILFGCKDTIEKKTPSITEITFQEWSEDGNWIGKNYYKGEVYNGIGYSYYGDILSYEIEYVNGHVRSRKNYYDDGGIKDYTIYRKFWEDEYERSYPPSICRIFYQEFYPRNDFIKKYGKKGEKRFKEISSYKKEVQRRYLEDYLTKLKYSWNENGQWEYKLYYFIGGSERKKIYYLDNGEVDRRIDYREIENQFKEFGSEIEKISENFFSIEENKYVYSKVTKYSQDGSSEVIYHKNGEIISEWGGKKDTDGDWIEYQD